MTKHLALLLSLVCGCEFRIEYMRAPAPAPAPAPQGTKWREPPIDKEAYEKWLEYNIRSQDLDLRPGTS